MSQKVAVVTGSNRGIGFAIVKKLAMTFDGIVYLTGLSNKKSGY
jgi:NAD(P)-dependent dehydrogenase (short-subunit alcohol dehydrogenase family)